MNESNLRLRVTFDEAAELYDRARPHYPSELFEELSHLVGLTARTRILEIGPGTGQATVPLAERGCEVIAVELGAEMAAVARSKTARFPLVTVVISTFEDWPLPVEPFDLVVSATGFHWLDPDVRMRKIWEALRPGGALAVISTHHISGGDEGFFVDVQTCYEVHDPISPTGFRLPTADEVPLSSEELVSSGHFDDVVTRRYEQDQVYSTGQYVDLLLTYSGHRALEPSARSRLLTCIAHLIDTRFGGRIRKRYLFELAVARGGDA